MSMNESEWEGEGKILKRWIVCVKQDMTSKGVDDSMMTEWDVRKRKTYCAQITWEHGNEVIPAFHLHHCNFSGARTFGLIAMKTKASKG